MKVIEKIILTIIKYLIDSTICEFFDGRNKGFKEWGSRSGFRKT